MVGAIGTQTGFNIASLALVNQKGGVQGNSEERNESAAERIREANAQKGVATNVAGGQVAGTGTVVDTRA